MGLIKWIKKNLLCCFFKEGPKITVIESYPDREAIMRDKERQDAERYRSERAELLGTAYADPDWSIRHYY